MAENIFREFGVKETKRLVRTLNKLLENIKPDCPRCHGTGFADCFTECGTPLGVKGRCNCKPDEAEPEGWVAVRVEAGVFGEQHIRSLQVRATEAEAEQDAALWREHHDSLKRKPRGVGPITVITTQQLKEQTTFDSCPVTPDIGDIPTCLDRRRSPS
jgi:hypothetical protein